MPVTIKTGVMKYKDPTTGNYVDVDAVGNILSDTIAPDYSDLTYPVAAGKLCYHESKLYFAKQAISTVEVWTASHWDEVTVEEELNRKYTKPSGGIPASDIANGVIPDVSGFYTKPASGIPASDIASGVIPDPEDLIDDEAGEGDTDKVWSADKISDETSRLSGAINAKYTKPETGIPASDLASGVIPDVSGKANEPTGTKAAGKVYGLNANLEPEWTTPQSGGGVSDVQVNGTSVVSQGVANVPVMDSSTPGVAKVGSGLFVLNSQLNISKAGTTRIINASDNYYPIVPSEEYLATFFGLAQVAGDTTQKAAGSASIGVYTETAKSKISDMLSAPEIVSGTTPSITAKAGVRYICGEVATLTIVVPASGIIDVTFDSGSTPTVLTVTPPTGMTMRWIGDDPTALEANKHYEVNIMDGCNGMVVSWT